MFEIKSTGQINISHGDSSGLFSMNINIGTQFMPVDYIFYPALDIIEKPNQLTILLDKELFLQKIVNEGLHEFIYLNTWMYNDNEININEYGITITGTPVYNDKIVISNFVDHLSEITLYIFAYHNDLNDYIIRKTFCTDGNIYTDYYGGQGYTKEDFDQRIVSNGKLILHIDSEDTEILEHAEYQYQVSVKLYDYINDSYIEKIITHPTPICIL